MKKQHTTIHTTPTRQWLTYMGAFLWDILLAFIVYMLCRVIFVWENWATYSVGWDRLSMSDLLHGSLQFDTSAICYTHSLWLILMLLPLSLNLRTRRGYQLTCKWIYVVVNSIAVIANLCDTVYSQYTGRRTTSSFFSEFANDNNLGSIFTVELLNHWYLVLAGAALIAMLWFLYRRPQPSEATLSPRARLSMPIANTLVLALFIVLTVGGIRGGLFVAIRPIANSNANQYVNSPQEAAIVLNTPFSIIRTTGKSTFSDPAYFTPDELYALYSPLHLPDTADTTMQRKNVVIFILESFAAEYIGAYNDYEGYTPFLDSLITHSAAYSQSFANGRKSIDAMPSSLSSLPMFIEPFFVSNYSLNKVGGIAQALSDEGYSSAFFHGADNGSMGFQAFARATEFQHYYGRSEYEADSRFRRAADFDGHWGIWDEPFMQYMAANINDMPQPFVASIFTLTSHHPFRVPDQYVDSFHVDGHPMYTCIRYVDHALRQFFATAKQQPWYENTIFVFTGDHTNYTAHDSYLTDLGRYRVPVIFFDPSGQMPAGWHDQPAQQIDIMPTLLDYLGYPKPYLAFGKSLLSTPADSSWAVSYNQGVYQYVRNGRFYQHDGQRPIAIYDYRTDTLLHNNLLPADPTTLDSVDALNFDRLKAIVQSYIQRMIDNRLTVANE